MTMTWERWDAAAASLEYCCARITELEASGEEGRPELEELLDHGMTTADSLLRLRDAPPLSTAAFRERWRVGSITVHRLREQLCVSMAAAEA